MSSDGALRVYGGVSGTDRRSERRDQLVAAGLELLGVGDGEPSLTVRGVCAAAGLAPRYFYESFRDRDELAVAVFDDVVTHLADATLAAVEWARPDARSRLEAGLSTLVAEVAADPRRGRLLFSPAISEPVLVRRRVDGSRRFARLLLGQAEAFYGRADDARLEIATDLLVGGLGQVLASWLDGERDVDQATLVATCVELFLAVGHHIEADGLA